ncbi:hypothetical protein XENOCAPTIV_025260 [Xenoophorus captivus]|uniref:Uncharacterized protein n=1 Tax=Xenoophorus captivus TaxID=1517983 RepID=A0ABV0RAD7_9TELE
MKRDAPNILSLKVESLAAMRQKESLALLSLILRSTEFKRSLLQKNMSACKGPRRCTSLEFSVKPALLLRPWLGPLIVTIEFRANSASVPDSPPNDEILSACIVTPLGHTPPRHLSNSADMLIQ